MTDNEITITEFPERHRRNEQERDITTLMRQWLNIIFMIGAIVGMCVYFFAEERVGTYIILGSMVFKIVECALRFMHR